MQLTNNVTEFILLQLTQDPVRKKIVFVIFLILYLATLLDNLLIIVTVKTSWALGSPMYSSFSTSPYLTPKTTISFSECMIQVFTFHFFGCLEIFILVLMAVDHYVAIFCGVLMSLAWLGSCVHSAAQILLALSLPFCGPNVINHYFCDLQPLLKLACTDTYVTDLLLVSNSGAICTVSIVINHSADGRKKALSTCISHIIVVILFFGPCIFIYTCPATTFSMDKMIAVFYKVGTPLFNPLIYTLRNAEVKNKFQDLFSV
uniref:G-protein coupled receptors family 1 profile domain-containing protein n=1 Tax=Capra hircus TaxID=9925 RepID=A0A452FMH0_CAPHI